LINSAVGAINDVIGVLPGRSSNMGVPPSLVAEDVIVRRDSPGLFTIAGGAGTPQFSCDSFEEALQRAGCYAAARHASVWFTSDNRSWSTLDDLMLLRRIWNEYIEMPGLRLTPEQGRRLWAVDADTCAAVLETLVVLKFLACGADGKYGRVSDGDPTRRRTGRIERSTHAIRHSQAG
jgi:hypothetical protein